MDKKFEQFINNKEDVLAKLKREYFVSLQDLIKYYSDKKDRKNMELAGRVYNSLVKIQYQINGLVVKDGANMEELTQKLNKLDELFDEWLKEYYVYVPSAKPKKY